jgi:hypothetical protein
MACLCVSQQGEFKNITRGAQEKKNETGVYPFSIELVFNTYYFFLLDNKK